MAKTKLKCSECGNMTVHVCPECDTAPLCTECKDLLGMCGECGTSDDGDMSDDDDLDVEIDDDDDDTFAELD